MSKVKEYVCTIYENLCIAEKNHREGGSEETTYQALIEALHLMKNYYQIELTSKDIATIMMVDGHHCRGSTNESLTYAYLMAICEDILESFDDIEQYWEYRDFYFMD